MAKVSALMAGKHYTTELWTDKAGEEMFRSAGVKYDKVVVVPELERYVGEVYSMPKIIVMMKQVEPYIHIDFDTIILNELVTGTTTAFAYPAVDMRNDIRSGPLDYLFDTYFYAFDTHFKDVFTEKEINEFDWSIIPNCNIIYAKNPHLIAQAYEYIIGKVGELANMDKMEKGVPQFIEEFMIIQYLKSSYFDWSFLEVGQNTQFTNVGFVNYNKPGELEDILRSNFIHLSENVNHPGTTKRILNYLRRINGLEEIKTSNAFSTMRPEWCKWFIDQAKNRHLMLEVRDKPHRKYLYTNLSFDEVPFHMEFKEWLSEYVDRDNFDMECYHLHVWEPGHYFDEHTDTRKGRMFTYVNELQASGCDGGLYVDDQLITEASFPTHTPHRVAPISDGQRISLTVFGYKQTTAL